METDDSTHLYYFVAFLIALVLFIFSSLMASAVRSLSRARAQRLAEQDDFAARALEDFVERQAVYSSAMLIVRQATLILMTVAALGAISASLTTAAAMTVWAVVGVIVIVFGWIVPRSAALARPEPVVLAFALPVKVLTWLLGPILRLITRASGVLTRSTGADEGPDAPIVTTAELKEMVAASEEEGLIEQQERTMIDNILELEDVLVREIMVPRPDIIAVAASTTIRETVELLIRERYSRFPVYGDSIDDVLGILYEKDLLQLVVDRRFDEPVGGQARPAYFVPESKRCDNLLRELQEQRVHMAIVVDEYGGTSGLVTIEDLLEEIVGEIQDEYDVEEQKIVPDGEGSAIVDGSVSIDDVNEALSLELATDEVDSIGGLVYERLGRVPAVGDTVRLDHVELTVIGAHRRRVTRVKVRRLPTGLPNGSATDGLADAESNARTT